MRSKKQEVRSEKSEYLDELEIAKRAVYVAAEVIKKFADLQNFLIDFKGRNDLVTEADVAAERKIIDLIESHFPNDEIMAEETEQEKFEPCGRTWIVDPIDGTTNFVHGFPIYCVSIGFWENNKPKAGVVLEVNSGECFHAVAGEGAFLNEEKIQVSGLQEPQNAMIGTGFPYNDKSFSGNYLDLFEWLLHNAQSVRRPGSAAYDLCCVAAGRFDAFYEHSLQPWDTAAAALIIQEAGGIVTDWQGGDGWLLGEYIAAGNPAIHAFLLDGIQENYHNLHPHSCST